MDTGFRQIKLKLIFNLHTSSLTSSSTTLIFPPESTHEGLRSCRGRRQHFSLMGVGEVPPTPPPVFFLSGGYPPPMSRSWPPPLSKTNGLPDLLLRRGFTQKSGISSAKNRVVIAIRGEGGGPHPPSIFFLMRGVPSPYAAFRNVNRLCPW